MIKRFLHAVHRISPNCREAACLMSQARESELPWADRLGLRMHLCICRGCRSFKRSIEILGALTRASAAQEVMASRRQLLTDDAKARILRKLNGH
jgi:hypothetical protein